MTVSAVESSSDSYIGLVRGEFRSEEVVGIVLILKVILLKSVVRALSSGRC